MRQYLRPRQFLRMVAAGFVVLVVVLAMIQSRHGNDAGIIAPLGHADADALASGLVRCRTVTLDQTAALESCRRLWAANRRQFLAPTKAVLAPVEPLPTPAGDSGESQDPTPPVAAEQRPSEVR